MEQCLEPVSRLQCGICRSFQRRYNKKRFSWKGGHERVKINIQRELFFKSFCQVFQLLSAFLQPKNLWNYPSVALLLLVKWKALNAFALNRHSPCQHNLWTRYYWRSMSFKGEATLQSSWDLWDVHYGSQKHMISLIWDQTTACQGAGQVSAQVEQ